MNIEIMDASIKHLVRLRNSLRKQDLEEIISFGDTSKHMLLSSYNQSVMRRTAFVDGIVAAMWGVAGTLLGETGRPWLLTSTICDTVSSFSFAKIYRKEVEKMLEIYPILVGFVDSRYDKAIRLLKIAGFSVSEPQPLGKGLFCRYERV